jgi:hypothetical protein
MSETRQRRRGYHHSMEVKTRETTKTCAAYLDADLQALDSSLSGPCASAG